MLFKEGSMWCQYQFFDLNSLSLYVLLGAIATAGALVVGLSAFHVGDCRLSQKMMRNRVGFQAATVALMAGASYLQGKTWNFWREIYLHKLSDDACLHKKRKKWLLFFFDISFSWLIVLCSSWSPTSRQYIHKWHLLLDVNFFLSCLIVRKHFFRAVTTGCLFCIVYWPLGWAFHLAKHPCTGWASIAGHHELVQHDANPYSIP